jgi:hypothetical protein
MHAAAFTAERRNMALKKEITHTIHHRFHHILPQSHSTSHVDQSDAMRNCGYTVMTIHSHCYVCVLTILSAVKRDQCSLGHPLLLVYAWGAAGASGQMPGESALRWTQSGVWWADTPAAC